MIRIVKEKISKEELKKITEEGFGTVVKVAVDVEKEILALGGEWHSEGQKLLVETEDSDGQNVWGINFYPFKPSAERIEYIALINIKSASGNRDMLIQDREIRDKIKNIINKLLLADDEAVAP